MEVLIVLAVIAAVTEGVLLDRLRTVRASRLRIARRLQMFAAPR